MILSNFTRYSCKKRNGRLPVPHFCFQKKIFPSRTTIPAMARASTSYTTVPRLRRTRMVFQGLA